MGESESAERPARGAGLELRLERGGAYVALRPQPLARGVDLVALSMEIPGVSFPFDSAGGAAQFRHRLCDLDRLELGVAQPGIAALLGRLALAGSGLASLDLELRAGFAEGVGMLDGGAPFTFKAALVPAGGQALEVVLYEPRLYAPAPICAAALPALLARAARDFARADGLVLVAEPLPGLLRRLLPARGWKVPRTAAARLALAEILPGRLGLAWDRASAAAHAPSDPDLLAAVEGARAFAAAERHLAAGDTAGARDAYLALGPAATAHLFGASRLLALLAADQAFHDQALDLAAAALARRSDFPPALLAVAQVRAARGERAPAAWAFAELAAAAARRGEDGAALAAADACLALGQEADPEAQARAVETALALRRDHLPALRALLALGERGDPEGLLRACRRLAAYAPGDEEKAVAHARLGTLLLGSDLPAARLHLDHALRLAPSDPVALSALARACEHAGDHLRAVRALDRLRELAEARGDRPAAAAAALEVAALWDRAGQPENALLRCREACELASSAEAEERAARLADGLGHRAEAADHWARVIELLDPAAEGATPRLVAAHRALAHDAEERLGEPARATRHLEAALQLRPQEAEALRQLARLQALLGRTHDRRDTLDRWAALTSDREELARILAESARLSESKPAEARRRWEDVAEALAPLPAARGEGDGTSLLLEALEGIARAVHAQGDLACERSALERLACASAPGAPRAAVLDRLAAALEGGRDAPGALVAAAGARTEEPTRERLETELRLARAAGDGARTAALLVEVASATGDDDPTRAARALLERARLLAQAGQVEQALSAARQASDRDPSLAGAHETVAALARSRDPALEVAALFARAQLARRAGAADLAGWLATAGEAALTAGPTEEGEAALREALAIGLDREDACAAWAALAAHAAAGGDAAAERAALEALAPLLPTGARPATLLRVSALALAAGDAAEARGAAERARILAPREADAAEACCVAAEAQGDVAALPDLLAVLAALEPARAGSLLLRRARGLAALGRAEEADRAMKEALAAAAPDASLATEHARLRQEGPAVLRGLPWGEPLEAFARRAGDPRSAARALREAATLALEQGDGGTALRCARGAFARTQDDLGFAGPLLALVLYRMGGAAEAIVVHRHLFEAGLPGAEEGEAATLCRQLAELAEDAGDVALALGALDRLIALQPHEAEAALRRFELDPDRSRAVHALADAAAGTRVARLRAAALARAAAAARTELADPALSDALFARARAASGDHPAALARVEARRSEAVRAACDAAAPRPPTELLDALRDLAAARDAAGDTGGAAACLEEMAEVEARHGSHEDALRDLFELERGALAAGDGAASARHARAAGALLLQSRGDAEGAETVLRRAVARAPSDLEAWRALEAVGRARGEAGTATVLEALLSRAAIDPLDPAPRREAANLLLELGSADEARRHLWALLRGDPRDDASADALLAALPGRHGERAELFMLRASAAQGSARAALLGEASRAFFAAGDEAGARAAARDAFDADPADDGAFRAALRDAASEVSRLDAVLAARAAAVPADAAGCHRARADALLAAGQVEAARAAYHACLDHAPADADVLAHVAEALAAHYGDTAAAQFDLRIAALSETAAGIISPEVEARSRRRLGLAAAQEGRAEDAARLLARALALAPGDARTRCSLAALAEAHATLGENEAALAAARCLVEAAEDEPARREALELGARLAQRWGDRGADSAGLLEGLAALSLSRDGGDAAEVLAERAVDALLRAGENARATALVALAARTARGPRRAAWLARLATAAGARGDLAAARAAREEALLADPSDAALLEAHLIDLEAAGDAQALARVLEAALAKPGVDVAALSLRRARALAAIGDERGAERSFGAVVDLGPAAPGWEEAARGLAPYLEARGDLAGLARLELARASALEDPATLAAALLAATSCLERCGDLAAARDAAERARDADPDQAAPWHALARLARSEGDLDGAARALLAVAIRSEGQAAAAAALEAATLLDEAGRPGDAGRALLAAVSAVPGTPSARRALAERARAAGDAVAAARHLAAVETTGLAPEERLAHQGALARALSEAADPAAEKAWQLVFDADPADGEAFDRVAAHARGRGEPERWLALAARHEGALSGTSYVARRRDLRCERAAMLADLGRLDAAAGAWQAALALDPRHRPAARALRALLERRGDHAGAADALAAEAVAAEDPAEAAELLLDEARLRLEKLCDRERSATVLEAAAERVRGLTGERAERILAQAEQMRAQLAPPQGARGTGGGAPGSEDGEAPTRRRDGSEAPAGAPSLAPASECAGGAATASADPEAALPSSESGGEAPRALEDQLRALAASTAGAERARHLDQLAERLEGRGDRSGAADAALAALEAGPANPERFGRAVALAGDDHQRRVAAHRLGVRGAATPVARAEALRRLGELLATAPESLAEAVEVLERACALAPSSGATAAALGHALLALGHPSRAMSILALFEGGAPDLPAEEAARLLALAAQAAGDAHRTQGIAHRAAEHALGGPQPPAGPEGEPAPRPLPIAAGCREATPGALEAAVARARTVLFDGAAMAEVAALATGLAAGAAPDQARRLAVLARAAAGIASFASGDGPTPHGAPSPVAVSREARDRAAHPLAGSAAARLVALLAPWLEGLFPADLSRRGVSGRHRLGARRAPELLALMEDARRALGARPFAAFLSDTGGCEIAVENTQPPSLVLGAGLAGALAPQEQRFLLARSLALVDLGWALAGKFAPRDVAILCELACRFAGAARSSTGLSDESARPFLDALERLVPPAAREHAAALAPEAARDLVSLAPRELAAALRQTASRLALLHGGEVRAALTALVMGERRLGGLAREQALSHPDVRDLAAFALSETHLELRAAAEGVA